MSNPFDIDTGAAQVLSEGCHRAFSYRTSFRNDAQSIHYLRGLGQNEERQLGARSRSRIRAAKSQAVLRDAIRLSAEPSTIRIGILMGESGDDNRELVTLQLASSALDDAGALLNLITAPAREVIRTFIGRVDAISESTATVSLFQPDSGERSVAECDRSLLAENAIGENDEFRCEVIRSGGQVHVTFTRLVPNSVSEERVHEIRSRNREIFR